MKNSNLTFTEAVESAMKGSLVVRAAWKEKDTFIFIRPEDSLPINIVLGAKSLPNKLKDYFERKHQPIINENDVKVKFTAYLCMKGADDVITNGWHGSEEDRLATDWLIVK